MYTTEPLQQTCSHCSSAAHTSHFANQFIFLWHFAPKKAFIKEIHVKPTYAISIMAYQRHYKNMIADMWYDINWAF